MRPCHLANPYVVVTGCSFSCSPPIGCDSPLLLSTFMLSTGPLSDAVAFNNHAIPNRKTNSSDHTYLEYRLPGAALNWRAIPASEGTFREAVQCRVVLSRHGLQGEKNGPLGEARRNPRMRAPSERQADLAGKSGARAQRSARPAAEGFAAWLAKVAQQCGRRKVE